MVGEQVLALVDSCRIAGKEPPEFISEDDLYETI